MKKSESLFSNHLSRRTFVKNSALATGGGLLLGSLPIGSTAYAAGSDILKVAVVGCGGRGTGAANQALVADDGVKIVALADAYRDRIDNCYNNLQNRWGDSGRLDVPEERKFVGFDAYKHAIAEADVVILTTPPGFAPKHFEAAIDAGKHVFLEKPVATDAPGIRRVLESGRKAQQNNLSVVVGLQRRYQDRYLELAKRVHNNDMGRLISGQVYWNDGGVWVRERQPDQNEMDYQMRNWYYFTWLCGDHIVEQHIHNIDVANWFIGDYPVSAQGMGGREVRDGKDHGHIFDHHFVEFTYPNGQVIASQCRHIPNTMSRVDEFFQFSEGTVHAGAGLMRDWAGSTVYDHDSTNDPNPYQVEHDDLFAAIRSGNPINDTEVGAKATLSAIMGRMATYSGKVITWEDAMNNETLLVPDNLDWDVDPPVMPDENGRYPVAIPGVTDPY